MSALLATLAVPLALGLQAATIDLLPDQDPKGVLLAAHVFVDAAGDLGVEDVIAMPEVFARNESGFINPGTTAGVVWIRFDLRNAGTQHGSWVVSLNRALVDPGEIFLVRRTGTSSEVETLLADTTAAYASSYEEFGTLAARFALAPGEAATVLLRYRGGNWSGLIPSVSTARTLARAVNTDLIVLFTLIGAVLTLVLYTTVSFLLLDRQTVFLYALSQTALLAFYVHFCGFTTVYVWPLHPEAGRLVAPATLMLSVAAMLQFARRFFDTRAHTPRVDRLLAVLLVAMCAAIATLPMDQVLAGFPRRLPLYVGYLVMAAGWFVLALLALHATFRRDRDYWPMAVSWSVMAAFMLSVQLVWTGLLDAVPLDEHVYGVVVFAEAVFLALGIALRIRRMRTDRIEAERRLNESLAAELAATQRARRLAEEREWALGDLAEKGRLILAAGHDTRQMISSLRHYALGIQRDGAGARVAAAGAALTQIANSLDEVLATAIGGSASGGIGDRTVALEALTPEQVLDPLKLIYGGMALQKAIDLGFRAHRATLVTDRVLVARIVGNLLANALKYTDHGRVLVTCRRFRGGWRFQVLDTGHGIDPASLEQLLTSADPGLRLEAQTDGHGAGLHIARRLAVRLGGTLHARSIRGRGSCFELRLPGLEEATPATPVIVLDTDPQHVELIRRAAATKFKVEVAASGENALALLASHDETALVLIDENFGDNHGGLTLARDLADAPPSSVIAVMSYDRSIEARMRISEVSGLIVYKPVSAGLLQAAMRTAARG